jgi:uncharacterized RDD family membrane protein YckC
MSSPTMDAQRAQSVVRYAGFWRRFVALIIDYLVVGGGYAILLLVFGVRFSQIEGRNDFLAAGTAATSVFMISIVGSWLYFALMESSKNQGTLGKMALGLRVTDLDGRRINFGRATGRFFARLLSWMTMSIGYIMAGLTPKKQALHDFVAGTLVLSKQSTVPAQVAENAFAAS